MIDIIFASQTGTSEDIALELAFRFKQNGWNNTVRSTEKLTIKQLQQMNFIIFLISTTGDGEPPDSLVKLWEELLNKSLPKELFTFKFSVFGFGDSKYGDHFNAMARKLQKRITMLGGKIVSERGLGDEQDTMGYRNQFKVWLQSLILNLKEQKQLPIHNLSNYSIQNFNLVCDQLIVNKITTLYEQPQRTTCFVQFQTKLQNQPGDILTIFPKNKDQHVKQMLDYFSLSGQEILTKQGISMPANKMFKQIINISDTAPFLVFDKLFQYTKDDLLKTKLQQIKNTYSDYHQYVKQYRRCIVQILEDFPVKIDLDYFLQVINFIKPRKYSISTSKKGTIGLLVRLVEYNITPYRKMFGKFSKGILDQGIGSIWRGYVTPGKFKLMPSTKYFMVGVGTGIAPFLSFLDKTNEKNLIYLNFGNRTTKQFYLKDVILQKVDKGIVTVKTAFSRDENQKMHVQQLFKINKQQINRFFDFNNSKILICGPYSKFAQSIIIAFQKALDLNQETINHMKKRNQILSQCW